MAVNVTKNGKVVSADVTNAGDALGYWLKLMEENPNALRSVEPMDMPSVSYGSRAEFDAAQKAAEKRWISKYGSLNNSNERGGKPGKIEPSSGSAKGGFSSDYNPGEKGISYRYSPTSGGSVMATAGGEIRGNTNKFRQNAIRSRLLRGKQQRRSGSNSQPRAY